MLTIEKIIEKESIFSDIKVNCEELPGGYVNKTYKIKCTDRIYCVRINNSRQTPYLGLDTVQEAQAIQQANLLGIAPKVYNLDHAVEYLITDFFAGKCLSGDDASSPEIMKKYVRALKLVHDNIKVDRIFSIYDQLNKYIETARICNMRLPAGTGKVMAEVERIRKIRSNSKLLYKVFSHNDTFNNNILYDGDSVCIIDWEYCGYGDGFFDFAHLANCVGLTDEDQQLMLKLYFGYYEPEIWEMLRQMKYISDVYGATWFIFHASIAEDETQKENFMNTAHTLVNKLADQITFK
ncbi:MAG: phosphotransferase [Firmicutes bacterium]|nr:phosphotransferase [Bacillota bacterium]